MKLPDTDITVVHRSDGSGTSYIWVDYLAKVSPEWKKNVGVSTAVKWPVGLGGKGNEGVAGLVKQTPGSIGYVELIYALQNKIAYGAVQNANGEFVKASIPAVTAAAAAAAKSMPADFRVSITNAPGAGVYPISSFTWLLLYENPKDKAQSKAMVEFMKWALTDGQKMATDLGYAPLPAEVVKLEHGGAGHHQGLVDDHAHAGSGEAISASSSARASSRRSSSSSCSASAFELWRQSMLTIEKFGFGFWLGEIWDPVSGEFGARPFIWGTLYSSVLALLLAGADRPGHRHLPVRAVPGPAADAADVPDRAARRDPVDRLRPVGHLRPGSRGPQPASSPFPQFLRGTPLFSGPAVGVGMLAAVLILADHGHPVRVLGGARGAEGRAELAA